MNIRVLNKTYMFEFAVANVGGGTAQQVMFPVLQNLDGKITQGLDAYSVSMIPKTVGGNTLANDAMMKVSYVNLYVGEEDNYWNLPCSELMTIQNNSGAAGNTANFVPFTTEFDNKKIIWAKSYVWIADPTKIVPGEYFQFQIRFADEKEVMDTK
jgi:hypothetical protein